MATAWRTWRPIKTKNKSAPSLKINTIALLLYFALFLLLRFLCFLLVHSYRSRKKKQEKKSKSMPLYFSQIVATGAEKVRDWLLSPAVRSRCANGCVTLARMKNMENKKKTSKEETDAENKTRETMAVAAASLRNAPNEKWPTCIWAGDGVISSGGAACFGRSRCRTLAPVSLGRGGKFKRRLKGKTCARGRWTANVRPDACKWAAASHFICFYFFLFFFCFFFDFFRTVGRWLERRSLRKVPVFIIFYYFFFVIIISFFCSPSRNWSVRQKKKFETTGAPGVVFAASRRFSLKKNNNKNKFWTLFFHLEYCFIAGVKEGRVEKKTKNKKKPEIKNGGKKISKRKTADVGRVASVKNAPAKLENNPPETAPRFL